MAHKHQVIIVGGGLAGSEAAWQLAKRGISVRLHEMRPGVMTKAHKTGELAELVCSNSFRGAALTNAVGLLKEELRLLDSLIMRCGDLHRVPAGGAMAVDRVRFSMEVGRALRSDPLVDILEEEITEIPEATRERPVIIATGPLTSRHLAVQIKRFLGQESLSFFDAISPIILGESLNMGKIFRQSRYDKGGTDDYLNIPLTKEQYYTFVEEVRLGEKYGGHEEVEADSIENLRPFEGCMPIEDMVKRGSETLRFGPFKPVGLRDPASGKTPFAVVQLRQDDKEGELWSMVGMQTRLKHPEQLRIFRSLPGLEQADFVRLGSVHRNTFIDSPKCLNPTLELKNHPGVFFAGQITGVEGYVESTAGGMVAGINAARVVSSQEPLVFPRDSAIGSLINYISDPTRKEFQPMNISFGLMPSYFEVESQGKKKESKEERRLACSERALRAIKILSQDLTSEG